MIKRQMYGRAGFGLLASPPGDVTGGPRRSRNRGQIQNSSAADSGGTGPASKRFSARIAHLMREARRSTSGTLPVAGSGGHMAAQRVRPIRYRPAGI